MPPPPRLWSGAPPDAAKPPGSADAIGRALDGIGSDDKLTALIAGRTEAGNASHDRLETVHASNLAELTPLHSRTHRLAERAKDEPAPRPARRKKVSEKPR